MLTQTFDFYLNTENEPISLQANESFTKATEMIHKNSCLKERYGPNSLGELAPSPAENHAFFLRPKNFPVIHKVVPVFSRSKPDCFNDILMPMNPNNPAQIVDPVPHQEKKNVVFWRGTNQGGLYTASDDWINFPKAKLMEASNKWRKKHSEEAGELSGLTLDAGFVEFNECEKEICEFLESRYGIKPSISFNETMQYRYLIVVDGNTVSPNLQYFLQSNSTVLYNGIFTDWYNWMLKPWVHYIPFLIDSSDLESKLAWIERNKAKAFEIGENARKLMKKVSRVEQMQCYTGLLLLEYERLYMNGIYDEDTVSG